MITDILLPDQYTGNNATTVFARSFPVRNKNHLKVSLKNLSDVITILTVDVDYTVQGVANSNPATWTITTTTAVPTGHVLTIAPNYPFEQSTDFQNLGGFYPQTHEDAFDYQMVLLQQLREITDRCVKITFGSTISQSTLLSNIFTAETNAAASATSAATSATNASNSATSAATSATNASNSAADALQSSIEAASYAIPLWATGTNYAVGKVVVESNKLYRCLVAHTSGTFATDLGASKWVEISGASSHTHVKANITDFAHTHVWSDITGVPSTPPRERLTANRTYYVATTGSDSNDGLTAGTPLLTIQTAINYVASLDLNGNTVFIQLADGTYTAGATLAAPVFGGPLIIKGNASSPGNVIVSTTGTDAISVSNKAVVTVQDLRLQTTTSGSGIFADVNSVVYYANVVFGACALAHIRVRNAATVICADHYSIVGGAQYHIFAQNGVTVVVEGKTVTLTGTPAFSQYFVLVSHLTVARLNSNTFSGSATGARYYAAHNSFIAVSGAGATYLPGNSAGTVEAGGQYA